MPEYHIVRCSCHGQMIWVSAIGVFGDANTQVSGVVPFVSLRTVTNLPAASRPRFGECRVNHWV
jgi:hypothetical protein